MQLITLFSLCITSVLLTKCALADDLLKRLPFAPENGYQNNEKSIHPSPLKFDSSDALMRNNTKKHLSSSCAITPDSNGHVDIPGDWTSIGEWAFSNCQELKSVTFSPGSSLTTIGNYAFSGSPLLSVTIPASVTTIGDGAFVSCNSLAEVTFSPGSALTTIGVQAFQYTGLLSVTIPASVTTIGENAFIYCYSLRDVTFSPGSSLTTIGNYAFYNSGLLSVTIPASVTTIGEYAFASCYSMNEVIFLPGSALTTIGNSAFQSSGLFSVTIPASVTTIGDNAFESCYVMNEVIFLPGSALTTIRNSAFQSSGLFSVTIPASVTTIGENAFFYCNSMREVTFSPGSALTTIGSYAFYSSPLLSVTIPASVTTIGDYAFTSGEGQGVLAKLTFSPNSALTTIGNYAFRSLKLLSVTIPASVTSIGNNAFYECKSLTQITFLPGSALTTIGDYAFVSTDVSSVIIPASVTTIGAFSFYRTAVFKQKCAIPPDSTGHVDIPENWTHIPDKAFVSCSELKSIHIPASVTFIGYYAFYHNKLLSHVTFAPDSTLSTIGNSAFYSSGLSSLTLPASVITIGKDAFKDCNRLTQVTFASGSALTTIGNDAFGKYVHFECLNTQVVTYSVSAFLCRTPCYQANQVRQPDGSCVCVRGSKNLDGGCILCQNGYSTLQGGHQCIAAKPVSILNEKKCRGYPSIRNLLQENSVSIKYMSSSEEKMIVFSGVTKAFFDAVATVEVRYLISNHKVSAGGSSFTEILSKDQDYYNKRYLLKVPSYTGQTSFHLSFASCTDQLIKSASTGKYISKVRLIFYGVSPESMLSFETIAGCRDYYLDQDTPFVVDDGVCFYNPEMFE